MDAKNGKMRINIGNAFIHPVTGQFIGPGQMYFEPVQTAGSTSVGNTPDKTGSKKDTKPTASTGTENSSETTENTESDNIPDSPSDQGAEEESHPQEPPAGGVKTNDGSGTNRKAPKGNRRHS